VLWLQSPLWLRWFLAALIAAGALWVEFRPSPTVEYLFATESIASGETLAGHNTTNRRGPAGLLSTAKQGDVAATDINDGDPILLTSVGSVSSIPDDWWRIEVELPAGARQGNPARLVLIDLGVVVDGVIARAPLDDPLGGSYGSVAVSPAVAADVAVAAADGRVAVMIQPP
jgi:hypothetical protein